MVYSASAQRVKMHGYWYTGFYRLCSLYNGHILPFVVYRMIGLMQCDDKVNDILERNAIQWGKDMKVVVVWLDWSY